MQRRKQVRSLTAKPELMIHGCSSMRVEDWNWHGGSLRLLGYFTTGFFTMRPQPVQQSDKYLRQVYLLLHNNIAATADAHVYTFSHTKAYIYICILVYIYIPIPYIYVRLGRTDQV